MISFLSPWFLAAGAAALIPLILHLIQSSRTVQLPFSTIRFLKLADQRSSRRIKMEHFLLWLMRTLLMALLALAFAMPMLRTQGFGSWLGRAPRDVALVIDTSCSMQYLTGRDTVWDRALATAVTILEGLSDQDRFCVYLADEDATPLIEQLTGSRQEGIDQIKALKPGFTTSRLGPAVMAANSALDQEKRRREREIHILTDNQALPWTSFGRIDDEPSPAPPPGEADGGSGARWDPSRIADRTAFFVTLLGVSAPENVAPIEADLNPHLLMADMPSKVEVGLTHSGPPQATTVTLFVDGQEVARRSTIVGDAAAGKPAFAVPPLKPGVHPAWVETPDDNLPQDNRFFFLLRVRDKLPSLCVGTEDDTFFLRTALRAGQQDRSAMELKLVSPEELPEVELRGYTCIFLCNAIPLPGQEMVRIEDYVRMGGLLVVFPGDRATPQDYAAWRCLPGVPVGAAEVPMADRTRLLRWNQPRHPLLRSLDVGAAAPGIAIRRQLTWRELAEGGETLVSSGAEHPFLLSRPFGNGQTLLLAVSADRKWSDFPLSPFFLPIAHQIVEFGAGVGGVSHHIWTGKVLSLEESLPEATRESSLLDPDGRRVPLRSTVVEGKTVLHAENLTQPGIYRLAPTAESEPVAALAVNMRRAESNLTPIDTARIPALLGVRNITLAESLEDLRRRIEEHRMGRTFGEPLLWLALILAAVEFWYANRLSQSSPGLSTLLRVDSSGRVAAGRKQG